MCMAACMRSLAMVLTTLHLKKQAEIIRSELLKTPDVAKVDFFGEQKQRIFIELSNAKLATLGISTTTLLNILQAQNAVVRGGTYDSPTERIRIEVSGRYNTLEDLREIRLRANNQDFKLNDVARVYRGYEDPPRDTVRFDGKEALFLGVSMRQGGDVIALGHALDKKIARIQQSLPVGLSFNTITSQPKIVANSVNDFVKSLVEALVIVLGVSLLSLGWRTGIVVAISIPVVLAATFLVMSIQDIGLHKISLGALILALGLLVDDAIIAVEMMSSKMEQGWDRVKAASFAYSSTAMPMLTGTLGYRCGLFADCNSRFIHWRIHALYLSGIGDCLNYFVVCCSDFCAVFGLPFVARLRARTQTI